MTSREIGIMFWGMAAGFIICLGVMLFEGQYQEECTELQELEKEYLKLEIQIMKYHLNTEQL